MKDMKFTKLNSIFTQIDLKTCDLSGEILIRSPVIKKISKLFPEWLNLIERGLQTNQNETYRTLRHTLRSLFIYFCIINKNFKHNINNKKFSILEKKISSLCNFNLDIIPFILLFHDIGRPFNRTWHTLESEKILRTNKILVNYNFPQLTKTLIRLVIKHHLLIGTIFTGESSYFSSSTLFLDILKSKSYLNQEHMKILFDLFYIFTLIDIWGYDYSKIYDHYFDYYQEICENLKEIFIKYLINKEGTESIKFKESLYMLDDNNLKWRFACSLRIFQFVNTEKNLSQNYYYSKIDDTLNRIGTDWNSYKNSIAQEHPRIQFKYTLGLMMALATQEFRRKPINNHMVLSRNLLNFWSICSEKIKTYIESNEIGLFDIFYFIFNMPHGWFFKKSYIDYVNSSQFFQILKNKKFSYDKNVAGYFITLKI